MNAFAFSSLLTGVSCALMAGIVYLTNRAGRVNQLWSIFCLAVSLWGFGALLAGMTPRPDLALTFWRIAHVGVIFIPILFYHFVLVYTDAPQSRYLTAGYAVTVLFLIADILSLLVTRVRYLFGTFYYNASSTPLYALFTVFFFAVIVWGHVRLWVHIQHMKVREQRLHANWLFLGTSIGFLGGATSFLPVFGVDFYPIGNFTVPLFPLMMSYAILRYRLIELNLAITKGASFLVIYTVALGLPLYVGSQYQPLLSTALGAFWWAAPVMLMGLLASLAPWIYIAVQKRAESKLLGERRGYQKVLWQASRGMTEIRELPRLLRLVVHVVTKTVGLTNAAVYLNDGKDEAFELKTERYQSNRQAAAVDLLAPNSPLVEWIKQTKQPIVLDRLYSQLGQQPAKSAVGRRMVGVLTQLKELEAAVLVPSFSQDKLIGFVLLGKKRSGYHFTNDDLQMFSTLANQAALAIENARFYQEDKQRQAALFHAATLASLGTMASSMGHQVNNRFNVVSVIASTQKLKLKEILSRNGQDIEGYRKALNDCLAQFDSLQEEAVRGGQIFTAIRKIVRPSADGHKPLSLKAAVQAGIDIVQYKVRLDEIDFHVDVAPELQLVGDVAQLGECFLNLIDNGYDAIKIKESRLKPEGYRGAIRIVARTVVEEGRSWVVIEVFDNGIGMTEKERDHLFIPFFTTKATVEKGTGLGLYVIKKIIEAHKGRIAVDSEHHVSTTFTIRLPAIGGPA